MYSQLENMYELMIFQGFKNMVFYWDFHTGIVCSSEKLSELMKEDRIQNIYGVAEGLKGFSQTFASEPLTTFRQFRSTYFKFTIFEVPSGFKIILLSQVSDSTDYFETLKEIYYNCYLEHIKRNPFYEQGQPLDYPQFLAKIEQIMEQFIKFKQVKE